jgi:glycosyltransferase involved in cell wall biosynthesis
VGIQNKILEAMALGTPVVASSQAAAGLQAIAGHDLLVADDSRAFAAAVLRLLDDPHLYAEIAANGNRYIATYHNWEQIIGQLTKVYAEA